MRTLRTSSTLGLLRAQIHSAIGSSTMRGDKLFVMNPRYRRMLIPGALAGLILIVVVAAALRG